MAPSTQNQALNALVFFLREGLEREVGPYIEAVKVKERRRLPVVLTREEIQEVLFELEPYYSMPYRAHAHAKQKVKEVESTKNGALQGAVKSCKIWSDRILQKISEGI